MRHPFSSGEISILNQKLAVFAVSGNKDCDCFL